MSLSLDPKNDLNMVVCLASVAVAANANTTAIDISGYSGNIAFVVNAGTPTAGTDCTQDYAVWSGANSNGVGHVTAGVSMTQITNTAAVQVISADTRALGKYVKLVGTIGGTNSPSRPIGITLIGTND